LRLKTKDGKVETSSKCDSNDTEASQSIGIDARLSNIEGLSVSKLFLAAFACGASVLIAAPVFAQPAIGTQRQVVVHFGDLDVTREEGARILLSRLEGATRVACGAASDSRDLTMVPIYRACLQDTMERAVADVHLPLVSGLFEQRVPEAIAEK
jgi:UrcA family protein